MSENSDGGKSFRERVEEIRRQRAEAAESREASTTTESSPDSSPDEEKSFRERVEEIRRQRAEAAEPSGTSASGDEMDADTGDTEIYAPDSTEDTAIYTEDLEVSGVSTTDFDSNFCPSCGTDISSLDDGSFCPQCGSSLPA